MSSRQLWEGLVGRVGWEKGETLIEVMRAILPGYKSRCVRDNGPKRVICLP